MDIFQLFIYTKTKNTNKTISKKCAIISKTNDTFLFFYLCI